MSGQEHINWPLFERTVAAIEAHPEHWNQEHWHCGTTHCFAGWVHILDLQDRRKLESGRFDFAATNRQMSTFHGECSSRVAVEQLGLNKHQAHWLFKCARTIEDFTECLRRRAVPELHSDSAGVIELRWPPEALP